MAPNVLSFAEHISNRASWSDWTSAELAELYRVEHALIQARVAVETDRGMTDEGDPWFVFCRADGEVVVHISRVGGCYHMYSPALPKPLSGATFSALTKMFLSDVRTPPRPGANISIHPAALLSVLIAAIFYTVDFHSGSAQAATAADLQSHDDAPAAQTHVSVKDSLFHALVANIKALFDPTAAWDNARVAFLNTVEYAAVAAAVVLSGLTATAVTDDTVGAQALAASGHGDHSDELTSASTGAGDQQHNDARLHAWTEQASLVLADSNEGSVAASDKITQQLVLDPKALASIETDSSAAAASKGGDQADAVPGHDMVAVSPTPMSTKLVSVDGDEAAYGLRVSSTNDVAATGSARTVTLDLDHGNQVIDLSSISADKVLITGQGQVQISGIGASDNALVQIAAHAEQGLSLVFASSAALPTFTIQLGGHDAIVLSDVLAASSSVHMILDSQGDSANKVSIADTAIANSNLNISVIGIQDLMLSESAQVFNNSTLDSRGLTGALTLSLNLDNVFQSVDLSQVNAANFVVGAAGNIALLHAASGSHIELSSDLNIVDVSVAPASQLTALALDLGGATGGTPIHISSLNVFSVANLTIDSAAVGQDTIETLSTVGLSTLTLAGTSAVSINAFEQLSGDSSQAVTIDGHGLFGALALNASGLPDTTDQGRSVTVIGGAGSNVVTNTTTTEQTTFVAGSGINIFNMGAGDINDTVVALHGGDRINVGHGDQVDTVIDARTLAGSQAGVDGQANLVAAAQAASNAADALGGAQAVVFSYHGSTYVFIDATGTHAFDAATDAIVKLVGIAHPETLTSVFHSA